jgi:hypothetical protein
VRAEGHTIGRAHASPRHPLCHWLIANDIHVSSYLQPMPASKAHSALHDAGLSNESAFGPGIAYNAHYLHMRSMKRIEQTG